MLWQVLVDIANTGGVAGAEVLAAIDKVMAERESVMADLDGLAQSQDGPPT